MLELPPSLCDAKLLNWYLYLFTGFYYELFVKNSHEYKTQIKSNYSCLGPASIFFFVVGSLDSTYLHVNILATYFLSFVFDLHHHLN